MKVYNNDNLKNNMEMVKAMLEKYYYVEDANGECVYSEEYYLNNVQQLKQCVVAVGTLEELSEYLGFEIEYYHIIK